MTEEIKARITQEVDGSIPLKDRIDLPRLKAALRGGLVMDQFITTTHDFEDLSPRIFNPCGTVGCIAGNTVLNEFPVGEKTRKNIQPFGYTPILARRILGITEEEAEGDGTKKSAGLFYCIFPSMDKVGTPAYNKEVRDAVKVWLKERGVKW